MESLELETMDFVFFVDMMKNFHPDSGEDLKYKYLFKIYDKDEVNSNFNII